MDSVVAAGDFSPFAVVAGADLFTGLVTACVPAGFVAVGDTGALAAGFPFAAVEGFGAGVPVDAVAGLGVVLVGVAAGLLAVAAAGISVMAFGVVVLAVDAGFPVLGAEVAAGVVVAAGFVVASVGAAGFPGLAPPA